MFQIIKQYSLLFCMLYKSIIDVNRTTFVSPFLSMEGFCYIIRGASKSQKNLRFCNISRGVSKPKPLLQLYKFTTNTIPTNKCSKTSLFSTHVYTQNTQNYAPKMYLSIENMKPLFAGFPCPSWAKKF